MWETANLNVFPNLRKRHVGCRGLPHLAKNERDMGHPPILGRDKEKRALCTTQQHIRSISMAFTWQSAGHAFASLFKDVVTVSKKVVTVIGGLQGEATVIESLTSLVSPQAAAVEQIAFGALGELVAAVQATETAAGANGVNITFDASVVAEVKKLLTEFPQVVAQVEAAFGKK
jgi:hypothetical protein